MARELGAVWAGESGDDPGVLYDAAIVFAPAGELAVDALRRLDKGGIVALGGIYSSPIPPIEYPWIYHERVIRSVANSTRQDARELLRDAALVPVVSRVQEYGLEQANEALLDLKEDRVRGSAVLQGRGGLTGARRKPPDQPVAPWSIVQSPVAPVHQRRLARYRGRDRTAAPAAPHRPPAFLQQQRAHCHLASLGGRGGTIDVLSPLAARCDAMTVDELRREALRLDHAARAKLADRLARQPRRPVRGRDRTAVAAMRPSAVSMPSSLVRSRPSRETKYWRRLALREADPAATHRPFRAARAQ